MLSDRLARRHLVVFIVLVGLCLAMLLVSGSPAVQEVRRGVNFAIAPVQETLTDGTHSFTDLLGAFGEIESLRRENLDLQSTVQQLGEQLAALDAVTEENRRLSRLLEIRDRLEYESTVAGVTSRHATQFERVLTIDRGAESGILAGAPVLSEGGALAGKVIEVGDGWASVMLISDTRSLVTGLDTRTRATGEITGRLAAPLAMSDIPVTDKIAINDRVVTAGIDLGRRFRSSYPKNIPIGRVVDVEQEPGSIVQTALVQPAADLERIEDVLVLTDERLPQRPGVPEPSAPPDEADPADDTETADDTAAIDGAATVP
jgi:rod shape-determining protein MreC